MQAHERMTRQEYDRLVAQGLFQHERVELIHGIVVEKSPIGPRHADPIDYLTRFFIRALADRAVVRVQQPFAASDDSEPEPDLALVPPARYLQDHPGHAFLVIEVAESSLEYDRQTKAPLYAASNVDEYWIVDVTARCIEVHDSQASGGFARTRVVGKGERIAPASFPDATLAIDELLPCFTRIRSSSKCTRRETCSA